MEYTFDGNQVRDTLYREGVAIVDGLIPEKLLDRCILEIKNEFRLADGGNDGLLLGSIKDLSIRSDRTVRKSRSRCPVLTDLEYILKHRILPQLNKAFKEQNYQPEEEKELVYLNAHKNTQTLYIEGDPCITCYPADRQGKFIRHLDGRSPGETRNRRITMIFYLNKGWETSYGGKLRTWTGKEIYPNRILQGTEGMREIEPIANRLVLFWSAGVPHEVTPAFKDRYAITIFTEIYSRTES